MISRKNSILTEKEEQLLCRYHDGECSLYYSFLAKRLLRHNSIAKDFLHTLENCSHALHVEASTADLPSVDLWERIDNRIDQEQKAAFYLGERRSSERAPSFIERLRASQVAVGGLSGAAVAAIALLFVYSPRDITSFSVPSTASISNSENQFQQVGFGASPSSNRSAVIPYNGNRALEVDWMRSNGSLSLIPDATGSSAIIWVRRRSAPHAQTRTITALRPTPLGRAEPTATIAASREWLDGKVINGAK
jgi:hypothetical protein